MLASLLLAATYCNPLNLDYAYVQDRPLIAGKIPHRSSADPVFISHRGEVFLFGTGQFGYWKSKDLASWTFVPHLFRPNGVGDQVCAPGAWPTDQGVLFLPCFGQGEVMPLYLGTDLAKGQWQEANPAFPLVAWDPSFFQDDDGRVYIYWGSSNSFPLYAQELDPQAGYAPIGERVELMKLDPDKHGWERFGDDNLPRTDMAPFMEGAWMNKFQGRYYLQYGAPGTEVNVYGDGVYVGDKPLGPFRYQPYSPFSWKPTGFIRGAGHGSTFADPQGRLWHAATMVISVKNTFERRIGLFPAAVDADGTLHADTAFGDYPHTLGTPSRFAGWTLLTHRKKAWADAGTDPALAFDEDVKTYWSAPDGRAGRFLACDLGAEATVHAVQVNYADEQATLRGKVRGLRHRYRLLGSHDGRAWFTVIDKSRNTRDVPHDYVELPKPVKTRYLKLVNQEVPTGRFAISGLRAFGRAPGAAPGAVAGFTVVRPGGDRRDATLAWQPVRGAYAYQIRYGLAPGKLYHDLLVHDATRYTLRGLNTGPGYHFTIRAVGATGLGPDAPLVAVP